MTDQKFSRKRALVVPRQILCYIAGEMGYKDNQIAYVVNRDRTTVLIAKGVVLDALTYGTVEYVKAMQQFTTRLKDYPGGDVLKYLD
jgi:chromosomal replication initiation ATPase DnaA